MPSNGIQKLTPLQLSALAAELLAATPDAAAQAKYGVSAGQVSFLVGAKSTLDDANTAVDAAKSAYHAAVQERDQAVDGAIRAAAGMARSIYAHPGISPGQIAAAGLSPRSTSKARLVPNKPVGLTDLPQENGGVLLTWSRAGNPEGIVFSVEAKVGAGEWSLVMSTTRVRLVLADLAASGETTAFRVSASKNGVLSSPSAEATLYGPASPVRLKLAA